MVDATAESMAHAEAEAAAEAAAVVVAKAAAEAAEWAAAEAEMEAVEAPPPAVPLVDDATFKLFEAALWELADGGDEEAEVRSSDEEGVLDADAPHVHATDRLSRDVAGKLSIEEQAVLRNLDNLTGS